MDSIFGKDPAEYWVKIVYDSGREELHEELRLNEAHTLKYDKEREKTTQQQPWKRRQTKEHIAQVISGRNVKF